MEKTESKEKDLKLFSIFTGIFVSVLVLSAPLASKFIAIGPYAISGATLIFPITFIFNDIFTEVYGYQRSRKIIWTGMGCQIFAAFMFFIVGIWPSASFWNNQEAYNLILGNAPRFFLAGIIAYFFGEFANSFVLSKMKYTQKGKKGIKQAWRFVVSTIVGESVDTTIFVIIAFIGTLATKNIVSTIIMIAIFKILYEIIALPFSMRFAEYVKKIENIDVVDYPNHTNYNPFHNLLTFIIK